MSPKKIKEQNHQWAIVILKPLRSQVRETLVSRIGEVFSMSQQEASDVVLNTPIILIDHLPQAKAVKVKDFFRSTGAEMFLTNDEVVKSKCYRTVWSEPPKLSFLEEEEVPQETKYKSESPKEEEATPKESHPTLIKKVLEQNFSQRLDEQTPVDSEEPAVMSGSDSWKDKYEEWKGALSGLGQEVERLGEERESLKAMASEMLANIGEYEQEIKEHRGLLQNIEGSYHSLREEYDKASEDFAGRFNQFAEEVGSWKAKIKIMMEKMVDLEQVKKQIEQEFQSQKDQFGKLEGAYLQIRDIFEDKIRESEGEIEKWKAGTKEITERFTSLEQSREMLEGTLNEQQGRVNQLDEAYQQHQKLAEEKAPLMPAENYLGQFREQKMIDKLDVLEKLQMQLVMDLQERLKKDHFWEMKVSQWDRALNDLRRSQDELKKKMSTGFKKTRKGKGES